MVGSVRATARHDLLAVTNAAALGDTDAASQVVQICLPKIEAYLVRRGADQADATANTVLADFLRVLPDSGSKRTGRSGVISTRRRGTGCGTSSVGGVDRSRP